MLRKIKNKTKLFGLLFLAASLLWAAAAKGAPPTPPFVSGEILVKVRTGLGMLTAQRALADAGLRLLEQSTHTPLLRVQVPPGREAEFIARLAARPDVEFAGYNEIISIQGSPNDPGFSQQYGLHNTGQTGGTPNADIDAPEAWNIFTGSSAITIAVVDTGVQLDHPDLSANIWVNPREIPANGLDDDANGYVDDVNGYDFINNDNNPTDDHSHGTHVAGIAAARGNNGLGVAGVNWAAKIMALKILNKDGDGGLFDLQEGLYYAADNGAQIINMSLGGGCSLPLWNSVVQPAIDYAVSKGALLVAASGNSNTAIFCPAAMPGVLAVGATNHFDTRWVWNSFQGSNFGPELAVSAPGEYIYSTLWIKDFGATYGYKSGTSMATPHVAGLAALVWGYAPTLPATDVAGILAATADDKIPPPLSSGDKCVSFNPAYAGATGWDPCFGYGRINAARALNALVAMQTAPPQINFLVDPLTPTPVSANILIASQAGSNVSWSAVISPSVSWLSLPVTAAGVVSAGSSPAPLALAAARPASLGVYSTTVIVSGVNTAGQPLGKRTTKVNLTYTDEIKRLYLPLILKNVVFLSDIIVESMAAGASDITITLKNQGTTAVTNPFWVDVYFDPAAPPQLNQPWDTLAAHGAAWGVTTPLAPGQALTLTLNDAYFYPEYSSAPPFPLNVPVYALADSINHATAYGNVLEINEDNNRFGPVLSTAGAAGASLSAENTPNSPGRAALPARR